MQKENSPKETKSAEPAAEEKKGFPVVQYNPHTGVIVYKDGEARVQARVKSYDGSGFIEIPVAEAK